jgi:GTP-binding protein Era
MSSTSSDVPFRAGLAVLLGRANVGKSTLLNALVDSRVSIVTPKPQTTRHAIQGVVNRPQGQIVFVDTPGFFHTRKSELVDRLHTRAQAALEGIDVVVHVVDPTRAPGPEDAMVEERIARASQPRILCLNKSDLKERPHRDHWLSRKEGYAAVVEVSAARRENLEALINEILPRLPEGERLYPDDEITNASLQFRLAEIIREKIYLLTDEEVPYRTAVRLDSCDAPAAESGARGRLVRATILVSADRYKAMLIGAGGQMIRKIRVAAQKDISGILGEPARLELMVKVAKSVSG